MTGLWRALGFQVRVQLSAPRRTVTFQPGLKSLRSRRVSNEPTRPIRVICISRKKPLFLCRGPDCRLQVPAGESVPPAVFLSERILRLDNFGANAPSKK